MSNWVVLSRIDHAVAHWLPRDNYGFAKGQQAVPILLAELSKLLPQYVIGFLEHEGRFHAAVLTGLGEGRNLYLDNDGRWLSAYVPATLRGYPFALLDRGDGEKALSIEETHLLEGTKKNDHPASLPLFQENKELTSAVAEQLNFLNQWEQNRALTETACKTLGDAGLITPWPIQLIRGEGKETTNIGGVYRINEELLNSMNILEFAELRSSGAMTLAYAQLFSINQLEQLNLRDRYQAQQRNASSPQGVGSLFEDRGTVSFDFMNAGDDADAEK